jgi:hypothetical protein
LDFAVSIPSNTTIIEKELIVKLANGSSFGIFLSDLPQNHDLFQLLVLWKERYKNIPNFGTAVISPLAYNIEDIKKQLRTIFEIFPHGLEIGFGVGDKNLLKQDKKNSFSVFKEKMNQILLDQRIETFSNNISLAGSGPKLLEFTNEKNLGLIYNGKIDLQIINSFNSPKTKTNTSSYLMVDINDYNSLSTGFISIVSRIISGLPRSERIRLKITENEIYQIQSQLQKKDYSTYRNWLSRDLIEKVALFGNVDDILDKLNSFKKLKIKQLILSIVGNENRKIFFESLKKENY